MTQEQFIRSYINFLKQLSRQGYSQDLMETACNLLMVLPQEKIEPTMVQFAEIAKKGLPEKDYHWEISQVFKEIMGQ